MTTFDRLIGTERAGFIFTDPPYNVATDGRSMSFGRCSQVYLTLHFVVESVGRCDRLTSDRRTQVIFSDITIIKTIRILNSHFQNFADK